MHVKKLEYSESLWCVWMSMLCKGRHANQTTRDESYAAMIVWDLNSVVFCNLEKFNKNLSDVKWSLVESNIPGDQW